MVEIRTNPVTGGEVEITDPVSGTAAEVSTDGATYFGGSIDGMHTIDILYGFDGTQWRRVAVDATGKLEIAGGGGTVGTVISCPARIGISGGSTVTVYTYVAGDLAVTVQNVSSSSSIVVNIKNLTAVSNAGIYLPQYGIISFNAAVASLEAQNQSASTALVTVAVERP